MIFVTYFQVSRLFEAAWGCLQTFHENCQNCFFPDFQTNPATNLSKKPFGHPQCYALPAGYIYCGWRIPASPTGWLKHVETLSVVGCLPPFSTGTTFRNHPQYVMSQETSRGIYGRWLMIGFLMFL